MRILEDGSVHLTYCMNVHSGRGLTAVRENISRYAAAVKKAVCPDQLMGLGLYLDPGAALELESPDPLRRFKDLLTEEGLYVFTLNGFPYGPFHGEPVKENVYRPDWTRPERLEYTRSLIRVLARLLPEGVEGSISTVPLSMKRWIHSEAQISTIVDHLLECVYCCHQIEDETGARIHLGLEPEPSCELETTDEVIQFFESCLMGGGADQLKDRLQIDGGSAEDLILRHLGVCFDTCHVSIQYESLADSLRKLKDARIRVSKVQLSSALSLKGGAEAVSQLSVFAEPTYLHQVKAVNGVSHIESWKDLPQFLESKPEEKSFQEIRVHFHVPLYWNGSNLLSSTASQMDDGFFQHIREGIAPHLEIETYTFDVLPGDLGGDSIVESISAEYAWVLNRLKRE